METSPAHLVANRLRCLYACFLRAHAEAQKKDRSSGLRLPVDVSPQEQLDLCHRALEDKSLDQSWMPYERAYIATKLGRLRVWEMRAGIYCADSIDILGASLRSLDDAHPSHPPKYLVTKGEFLPAQILGDALASWLDSPRVACESDRKHLASLCEAYSWRFRIQDLTRTIAFVEFVHRQEIVEFVANLVAQRAAKCEQDGLFQALDNDFPVAGMPFTTFFEQNSHFALRDAQVASQRLRAALWLCNPESSWENVRAKTSQQFQIPEHLKGTASPTFVNRQFDPEVSFESFKYM